MRRAAKAEGWIGNAYEPDEAFAMVGRLNELRKEAGTFDRDDYEIVVSFLAMPSADLYERAAAAGITSTMCAPWMIGEKAHADKIDSRADARRQSIEAFAETIASLSP